MPPLLVLAPVPALAAALLAVGEAPLTLPETLYGATLALDVPGAMLLGAAAILWIAAAVYAATYLRDEPNTGGFSAWWLTAMIGNFGVFMAADIASFYLFFAMGSIGAYGLIIHNMTSVSRRAGIVYVGFALVGEACVLMGLVLLVAGTPSSSLLIRDAVAALPTSPWRDPALVLLIIGLGLKIGLVPLYVWMPLAYTAAPAPAAAVLSGAAVKAGVIGLIRFLPFDTALPGLGAALAAAGIISTFYGVAIGINRSNPKTVLAYSSVSQMGVIATRAWHGAGDRERWRDLGSRILRGSPCTGEGGLVSRDRHRAGNRLAQPVARRGSGSDHCTRPRGLTFYGRVPGESGGKAIHRRGCIRNFCVVVVSRHGALDALFHRLPYESAPAKRRRASAGRSDASVARHGFRRR